LFLFDDSNFRLLLRLVEAIHELPLRASISQ